MNMHLGLLNPAYWGPACERTPVAGGGAAPARGNRLRRPAIGGQRRVEGQPRSSGNHRWYNLYV